MSYQLRYQLDQVATEDDGVLKFVKVNRWNGSGISKVYLFGDMSTDHSSLPLGSDEPLSAGVFRYSKLRRRVVVMTDMRSGTLKLGPDDEDQKYIQALWEEAIPRS